MKRKKNNRGKQQRKSNLISTHTNKHITVIDDNTTNLSLCLVCKELLIDDDPNSVSIHVRGSSHEENHKLLFKMCIPDDLCDTNDRNCKKVISNSVFDLSILLNNGTSYIHRYENHIVCLVCQDIVCKLNHCHNAVKDAIFGHLQNEQHLKSIKQNVCWVYELETTTGFLMFHKTVMFCSICDQRYQTQKTDLLKIAINHLLTEHPKEVNQLESSLTNYDTEDLIQIQESSGNNTKCYLSNDWCEERYSTDVIKNTKASGNHNIDDGLLNGFQHLNNNCVDCNKSELNENVVENTHDKEFQFNKKMEIAQGNKAHPFIITIQCSNTFTFCVVCREIAVELSGSHIYTSIPSHLRSARHKESLEPIIYQCIPDPFCDKSTEKYNDLVAVLNSETGCVFQSSKNYIMCLICKNQITKISQSLETVKYDLVYHFGSKQHLKIMRENVWWFYYLQFSDVFHAFVNHISRCTECISNLESIPYRVVKCVKEHLLAEGLMQFDMKELEFTELICHECKDTVEIYNNDYEFSMNLHLEKHKDLSKVNNLLVLKLNDNAEYTCPVCLEEVLIFNKDIELSLRLHGCNEVELAPNQNNNAIDYTLSTIFDNLPDMFKAHRDFIVLGGNEFYCKLCNCTVCLPSCFQDACENVQTHISELYHKEQFIACNLVTSLPVCKKDQKIDPWDMFSANDPDTLSLMNSVIDENNQYIGKCERYYFCKICKCCFLSFGKEQETMKVFASHFTCKNHKKKLGRYVRGECSGDFIADENTNEETIESTLVQQVEGSDSQTIFNKLRALPGFQLNSQFFDVQGNSVFCKLCKISIPCEKINKVRKHCYSESHSMILVENAMVYITNRENKQLANATDPCNEKFINVLKYLAESHYRINNPTITPHLLYIDNNGSKFVCLVCNLYVKFSADGSTLVNHFMSKIHKKRTYSLNCNDPLSGIEAMPNVNQLQSPVPTGGNESVTCYNSERSIREKEIKNIDDRVSYFFEHMPNEYSIYRDFISADEKNLSCRLCSITLVSKKNFEVDCKILQEHISSVFHREQYQLYESNGTSTDTDLKKDPWERFQDSNSFETCLEVQQINKKNKEHIDKGKTYFMCCLCDSYFLYLDEQDMKITFASHCLTMEHTKNLKRNSTKNRGNNLGVDKNDKCQIVHLDAQLISRHSDGCHERDGIGSVFKTRSNLVISLNKHYLSVKESQYFCDVCQVFIKSSESGSHLKGHFYSYFHNKVLITNAIHFLDSLEENNTIQKSNADEPKFKKVLKIMAKNAYKHGNNVTGHLLFISYCNNKFVCRLCDKNIKYSENGSTITHHFISKEHSVNVLKLSCILRSHNPSETTKVEEAKDIITDNSSELNTLVSGLMLQTEYRQRTFLENGKLNHAEVRETSETREHSIVNDDVLYQTQIFPIKNGTKEGCTSLPHLSKDATSNEGFDFLSQSTKSNETFVDIVNDSSSHTTGIKCNNEASTKICDYSSFRKTKIDCEDEDCELNSSDSYKHITSLDCDASGKNIEMCLVKPLDSEMKSGSLTWDLVNIEVSPLVFDNNVDYMCPDCNEQVTVIDEDVRVSYELHYKSCHPNIEELLSARVEMSCNKRFIRHVFDCLPESYQSHMKNISLQFGDTVYCDICSSFIETGKGDIFLSAVEIYFHMLSGFHKEQEKPWTIGKYLNHLQRSKCQPDISIFANNVPEDVKLILSDSNTLLYGIQKPAKVNLDELELVEDITFKNSQEKCSEHYFVTTREEGFVECGTEFLREKYTSDSFTQHPLTENNHNLSICDEGVVTLHQKSSNTVSNVLSDVFKSLTETLLVHQKFLILNENQVICNLCSVTLNIVDVKCHLTDLVHKQGFLAKIKRTVGTDVGFEIKHLMFINNQLYCGVCQCYISPWSDFDSICQGVSSHLKDPAHRTSSTKSNYVSNMGVPEIAKDPENYSEKSKNVFNAVATSSQCKLTDEDRKPCPTVKHDVVQLNDNVTEKNKSSHILSSSSKNFKDDCAMTDAVFKKLKNSVKMWEENQEFITFNKKYYFYYCCLCDKCICYSPNYKTLAKNFNNHFTSQKHKSFFKNFKGR